LQTPLVCGDTSISNCPHRSIMDLKTSTLTEMLSACRELEEVAAGLHENLQDPKRRQLHICTKKEAEEARKQRAKVGKEFPPAQRARCTAQSRLQVTLDELNETLMSNTQQEKDLVGLRRTHQKLQEQLQMAKDKVRQAMEETNVLEKEEADLLLEHQNIQSRAEAMKSEEEALAQGVADERLKRMELKAACRQRIKKIEEAKAELQDELKKRTSQLDLVKHALKQQEGLSEASKTKMLRYKAEAEALGSQASLALQAMQQIHEEWGCAQKEHGQLEDALKQVKKDLQAEMENESQALIHWRQSYMHHLDAKLEARRSARSHAQSRQIEPVTSITIQSRAGRPSCSIVF